MEINLFQLENLFLNPNTFTFLDLRPRAEMVPIELDTLLKRAVRVERDQVLEKLREVKHPEEKPLVLICRDGETSSEVARQIEREGFQQIYVVAGGTLGLTSEL